jgi:glycosyltransferase involved in cell wall biosynthesis
MTNITTALAADSVWFNSAFHRDSFLGAVDGLLRRMPDYQPLDAVPRIRAKSAIHPPGVGEPPPRGPRRPGPLRILWAARWEHDKNPEAFFEALETLKEAGTDFRVSVIGQQFRDGPPVFEQARRWLGDRIDRWGHQESRGDYEAALTDADVIVSTADHEFFGISVVEAMAAGAYPLLPRRLAYPEILEAVPEAEDFLYEGSVEDLVQRLADLADRAGRGGLWGVDPRRVARAVARFSWDNLVPVLDDALAGAGCEPQP